MNAEEELMRQDRGYRPTDMDRIEDEGRKESGGGHGLDRVQEDDRQGSSSAVNLLPRKAKFMAVIVVVLVMLVFVMVVAEKSSKKKRVEEENQHLEDLLEGDVETEAIFLYSSNDVQRLRDAGYTGSEIEDFEYEQQDVDVLVRAAEETRKAKYEKEVMPYFNSASKEYKELLQRTWVGQEEFDIPDDQETWQYYIENCNVDYEKVTASGMQCFIKYIFADGSYGFMQMRPERYVELRATGNMVLSVSYCIMGNGQKVILETTEIIP